MLGIVGNPKMTYRMWEGVLSSRAHSLSLYVIAREHLRMWCPRGLEPVPRGPRGAPGNLSLFCEAFLPALLTIRSLSSPA